jgi:hypothetical protein
LVPQATGDINDMSDIHASRPANSAVPVQLLPIRSEKRFIPENAMALAQIESAVSIQTQNAPTPTAQDFYTTAAKREFVDYVIVRLPHRGLDSNGRYNPALTAEYRFLISPQTAQIGRNVEDAQAFTRAGWQFGVWGESLITINLSGHTPGQYWSYGLTDGYSYFAESWRNLQQLVLFFENNGYWFEGEESNEGPLAPGYARRRIKKHQDVQLVVGNFIWYGMFQDFGYTLDAEHPYRAEFRLSFLSWKERFRKSSPYFNSQPTNIERGHSYGAYAYIAAEKPPVPPAGTQSGTSLSFSPNVSQIAQGFANSKYNVNPFSPAIQSSAYVSSSNVSISPSVSLTPNIAGNPNLLQSTMGDTGG